MSAKITRSAKPAPKPPHKPNFPKRDPAKIHTLPLATPPNHQALHIHTPRKFSFLSWGILGVCILIGAFTYRWFIAAYEYVHFQADERALAVLAKEYCTRPLLTVVEAPCTTGELDCFTEPQAALLKRYELQARGENLWRAEQCMPLMPR
jgi:hypothetical protein